MDFLLRFTALPAARELMLDPGTRVNEVRRLEVLRTDGVVVGPVSGGYLVDWPRGGSGVVPSSQLVPIV